MQSRRWVLASSAAGVVLGAFGCAGVGAGSGGSQLVEIDDRFEGIDRTALLLLPTGWNQTKRWPMVLVSHGSQGTARTPADDWGFAAACDRRGWIGLFPNTGEALASEGADPWFPSLVDRVAGERSVDRGRICAAGFSGGQTRAYAFAARHSQMLAAIGGGGGKVGYREKPAADWDPRVNGVSPLSVLHFHGKRDPLVPVEGGVDVHKATGQSYTIVPVREGLEIWAEAIGATMQPNAAPPAGVPARCAFHRWEAPTGHVVEGILDPNLDHSWAPWATDVILDFFARVPERT